jgi:crossover junction endodeoxyribonuclease RusA
MSAVVRVDGEPAPQGSKRHVGNGVMVESSKKVKPWRSAVVAAILDQVKLADRGLDGPVGCHISFQLRAPRSASKKDLAKGPMRKPDIDKLARATLDALVTSGWIVDDARVVTLSLHKRYCEANEPTGAYINLWKAGW